MGNQIEMKLDLIVSGNKENRFAFAMQFFGFLVEGFQEDFNTINFITPSLFVIKN
jgi:hypothetical protein